MRVGDLVRWKYRRRRGVTGIVVSALRHGVNSSFVDVLVGGKVIPTNFLALEVINEDR